ncbi:glycosyltransferase family 2 protein [Nocardioides houyundeii]|uniref:glycosyltransferase family 2 protein n=1 Tax=Nocardioides houyundeii TaxID=2045452 RepID=UPI000C76922F|nr:glycosyltransferase family 2 protein [Nocardioides houyundeii]
MTPEQPAPSPRRVVAVVVTYNRLELLQRLVERLRSLPRLEAVLVLDNASTDGTGEWLASLPSHQAIPLEPALEAPAGDPAAEPATEVAGLGPGPQVLGRTATTNRGGAGGFHDGLAWATELGADLVWLMDDDGLPEPDCLELLLAHDPELDFWGPAVVAEQDPSRLCFPIRLPGSSRVVHDMASVQAAARDGLIADVVIPFNGVLVTAELVARIGLPREEFFIWGDDVEYLWRALAADARCATVVAARFAHPATDDLGTPMMFGRTTYNHSPSDLKHYCMARNNLVNLRAYRGNPHALAFVVKTLWFYLFTRPQPRRVGLSLAAMRDGLRGDFTGHRRFLA